MAVTRGLDVRTGTRRPRLADSSLRLHRRHRPAGRPSPTTTDVRAREPFYARGRVPGAVGQGSGLAVASRLALSALL